MKTNIRLVLTLMVAGWLMASCTEEGNIPSPGNNDNNLPGSGLPQVDVDDDSTLDLSGIKYISVKEAMAIGKTLPSGGITPDNYYIKGIVVSTPTWGARNGNNHATFYMADSPYALEQYYCYQVYDKDVKGWSEENLRVGNVIVVSGKIKNFGGTIETDYDAFVYASTWKDPVVETIGDGSKENPFTIADVKALRNKKDGNYYVRGYIVGAVVDESKAVDADNIELTAPFTKASNILLADQAGATDPSAMVPVEVPSKRGAYAEIYQLINLNANPGNQGKEVLLYGSLKSFCGTTGIISVTEAVLSE